MSRVTHSGNPGVGGAQGRGRLHRVFQQGGSSPSDTAQVPAQATQGTEQYSMVQMKLSRLGDVERVEMEGRGLVYYRNE